MTSLHKATSKADMAAALPDTTTNINGTPSLREFIWVIYHLIQCSQNDVSVLSNLGLLFVCIPYILWGNYPGDAYPPYSIDPGIIPLFQPGQDDVTWENYCIQWHYMKMLCQYFKTMNAALVDFFFIGDGRNLHQGFHQHEDYQSGHAVPGMSSIFRR